MKNKEEKKFNKTLLKDIKHFFKKMQSNEDMAKDFAELLEKWGCLTCLKS